MSAALTLDRTASQLLLIDLQERLLPAMLDGHAVVRQARILLEAARRLRVPVTVTEQYPRGLGPTVHELREQFANDVFVSPKLSFSGLRDPAVAERLAGEGGRRQIVVAGVEAHVCVLQTSLDALAAGYDVFVVRDAVSSRAALSVETAAARLIQAGARLVTTEMVLFEWLGAAGSEDFKALSALIR
jgi:nicotinamidase-related amidase